MILNTREVKRFKEKVLEQYGAFFAKNYVFLQQGKNIFLTTKALGEIDLAKTRVEKIGLYVAEVKGDYVRLSMQGAQLLANEGEPKEIVYFDEGELERYFKGEEIEKDLGENAKSVILCYKKNVIGSTRYKEGVLLNFLPKAYRRPVIV